MSIFKPLVFDELFAAVNNVRKISLIVHDKPKYVAGRAGHDSCLESRVPPAKLKQQRRQDVGSERRAGRDANATPSAVAISLHRLERAIRLMQQPARMLAQFLTCPGRVRSLSQAVENPDP